MWSRGALCLWKRYQLVYLMQVVHVDHYNKVQLQKYSQCLLKRNNAMKTCLASLTAIILKYQLYK